MTRATVQLILLTPLVIVLVVVAVDAACAASVGCKTLHATTLATATVVDGAERVGRVELFPPRAIRASDADYFAWLAAEDDIEAAAIREWVVAMQDLGPHWIEELFDPLRGPAAEYSLRFLSPQRRAEDLAARAEMLRSLTERRDREAQTLFEREREMLTSMLDRAEVEIAAQHAVVGMVMAARVADALDDDALLFSPHLAPNILRLLHATVNGSVIDDRTAVAVRQLAMDHAPRILEQRRIVLENCLRSAPRGLAAMARAEARGEPVRAAAASALRPVATGSASVAALNREVLALARGELPVESSDELERAFLRQVYGPIAADLHAFGDLKSALLEGLDSASRDSAVLLIEDDERQRKASRDRLLLMFDRIHRRYLERGLGHSSEDRTRFHEQLRDHIDSGERRAAVTLMAIRGLAATIAHESRDRSGDPEPERCLDAIDAVERSWRATVAHRIAAMNDALAVYGLGPVEAIETLQPARRP